MPFSLCFTLYLTAIFQVQAHGGAYVWRGDLTEGFFALRVWSSLYLEGLIRGGAYFRNFTVCLLGVQVAVEGKEWMVLAIDNYDYGIF